MKYHVIIGLYEAASECRFCGRKIRVLSTDETHVKMRPEPEHIHFSLCDHFYAICHRCDLRVHWNIKWEHVKTPHGQRHETDYLRTFKAPERAPASHKAG